MAKRVSKRGKAKNGGKTEADTKFRKGESGNPKTQFNSDNQPTPEAKSAGKRRKRELRELAEALVTGEGLRSAKKIAESVGVQLENEEYTLEIIMTLRQVEKAMKKGDTSAYNACMDRLRGKAPQTHNFGTAETEVVIKIGGNAEKDKT